MIVSWSELDSVQRVVYPVWVIKMELILHFDIIIFLYTILLMVSIIIL